MKGNGGIQKQNPEVKFADIKVGTVAEDGTFSGYASLFGVTDLARDSVEKGAFLKSLALRGVGGVRMLFQHDPAEPIGNWLEIREDARGLFVKGKLSLGVKRSREVLDLMRSKALDGLSIGFRTVKARKDSGSSIRHILEADLWEISIVTFPMLPSARVAQVKAQVMTDVLPFPTTREFEIWLRRDAGLSRGEARGVIARGFATVKRERDAAPTQSSKLERRLRVATAKMNQEGNTHA